MIDLEEKFKLHGQKVLNKYLDRHRAILGNQELEITEISEGPDFLGRMLRKGDDIVYSPSGTNFGFLGKGKLYMIFTISNSFRHYLVWSERSSRFLIKTMYTVSRL